MSTLQSGPLSDLRRGLVGSRRTLYQTSPQFKSMIDLLAQMLPLWVDGMAEHAERSDTAFREHLNAMMLSTPLAPAGLLDLTKDAQRGLGFPAARDQ